MFFQLRRADGQADMFSSGTLVRPTGETVALKQADVRIEVQDYWCSPRSGGRYPSRWRFQIPAENIMFELSPYIADQELPLSVQYWEGAINIQGQANGQSVEGHGYVEMTGYHTPAGQETSQAVRSP